MASQLGALEGKDVPNHGPAFVIKVAEDHVNALVLLAKEVFDGDLDVIEGNVGGAGGRRVGGLDGLGLDTLSTLDKEDAQALAGVDSSDEVVGEDTICDPFLGSVDNLHDKTKSVFGGELDDVIRLGWATRCYLHSTCHLASFQQ